MKAIEAVQPVPNVTREFVSLLKLAKYDISPREAVYEDMGVLNQKIERLYEAVVVKTRGARDLEVVRRNWIAAYLIAGEIRRAATFQKQMRRGRGIDSSTVDEINGAIKERLEFLLGYSVTSND